MDTNAKFQQKITEWREHPAQMVRDLFNVQPEPWQEEALENYGKVPRLAMVANKGPGKSLAKHLKIWTPSGEVEFGSLKVGDFVFAEDGTPTRVSGVYQKGVRPVYRVTFDDGSSTLACGEHLWKVRDEKARVEGLRWEVIDTNALLKRGVTRLAGARQKKQFTIPRQGAVAFPEAKLPIDPYVAGIWIGDGTRGRTEYCKPDIEVENEINRRGYKTRRREFKSRCDAVSILGSTESFRQLECFDENSPGRFIPARYKKASVKQRTDLLCGLLDSDGNIDKRSRIRYDTTSHRMAQDVIWLVRSLGGVAFTHARGRKASYVNSEGTRVECRDLYRVTLRIPFNPFRIPRKAARWVDPLQALSNERWMTRFIAAIDPEGEADCMCIEVEHPSHCYQANDFIVTHNTCVLAWMAWNFLLTRPFPKMAATSVSGDNLSDGFWSETAKWKARSPILDNMFEWTRTRIFNKENPNNWWMSARTWPKSGSAEEQANTLAGLHDDYIMFILDESGSIPDAVMVAAEAALTGGPIEAHVIQAGNPTQLSGPLYRAAHTARDLWYLIRITGDPDNPKRSRRMTVEYAREQIKQYGRFHPYVLVNIFGEFPPSSLNALIGPEEVRAAMNRYYRDYELRNAPKIIGVDISRYGDDASVLAFRQGKQMFRFEEFRNIDGNQGAAIVNRRWEEWKADAVFLDGTGGFGTSWEDNLKRLGRQPFPVHFNSSAHEKLRFDNRRAEMYWDLCNWIRDGGAVPPDEEFLREITETTYSIPKDVIILEPKASIKARIGRSPDRADAAALCFAEPISIVAPQTRIIKRNVAEYNPFGEPVDNGRGSSYDPTRDYNPYR